MLVLADDLLTLVQQLIKPDCRLDASPRDGLERGILKLKSPVLLAGQRDP